MKIRTRKAIIRTCSLAMVAFSLTGVALYDGNTGKPIVDATVISGEDRTYLTDVSDKYDTSALRSQYLNEDAVSVNMSVKDEFRWVIVDLGGSTLMDAYLKMNAESFPEYLGTEEARSVKEKAERNNEAFLSRLSLSGIGYEWKYSYTTLNNGVAIKIRNSDVAKVKSISGVKEVYSSESYAVPAVTNFDNNAHTYTTGIYDTSDVPEYSGEGMTVAVLDTGLDYTHAAFQTMPNAETLGLDRDQVGSVLTSLESYKRNSSVSLSDVYYNDKIPYAFDYSDDDADVYPSYSSHGTHVAGIIAGRDDSKIVNLETGEKFIGVAPDSQLVICKVFTDNLDNKSIGSANSIDILASLADCVTLGVDAINMSLGTSAGFSEEGFATAGVLKDVYERIEASGISLVCAASNDYSSGFGGAYGTNLASNPDSGTVGSPSTYATALSVASINGQKARYFTMNGKEEDVAFITDSSNANGKAYNFIDELYEKTGTDKSESLTLNYVVVGGVGRTSNYTSSVKRALADGNTIAVIKRGDISFAEKVQNAMVNGALACIVYNNVSGNIRMTLGEVNEPIPTCSISMDAGKLLIDGSTNSKGTVTFSYQNAAGPFMSDFSSWGPTPDLKLKPEITAHGGEITSAVPGGYEVMSGTSMASPNMSGAITVLRQYAQNKWADLSPTELRARVNQLLMSTATMARNEEGNPYSPRKQGAGLAGILDAIETQGYLTVEGDEKPKIELGDDPKKTGVYEMSFTVNSISGTATNYIPEVYVMTESLSSDGKTVAEKAYMLDNCTIEITAGGKAVSKGASVTVPANGTLDIKVKITLDDTAREYLDATFKNGMFLEGFVRLKGANETTVELGLPFLAFYGDWMKAPLFDYSTYEVEESEADKSVAEEDKLKASAAATRPLGMYYDSKYIVTIGSYLYDMEDNFTKILPSSERAAISAFDYNGRRTVYQLYVLYAGLLRAAKTMQIDITDVETGEVIYSHLEENVRKSYSAGGSNIGSMITLEIDPLSWNLSNNKKYTANFTGVLDYDGEGATERDSFSFDFTIDTEAPRIIDCRLRYEPYTENEVTKYRIYLDTDVYDNQYAMSFLPCYLNEKEEPVLLTHYPIPIYSTKGGVTTVTYEVTDCYEEYLKQGNFYIGLQDYALNEGFFQVNYVSATEYPTKITLKTDDKLTSTGANTYKLTLEQYESYKIEAEGLPANTAVTALTFATSGRVQNKENEVFSVYDSGTGTILVTNPAGDRLAEIEVTLSKGNRTQPTVDKIVFEPMLNSKDYLVSLDRGEIELNPNSTRQLVANVDPWYSDTQQTVEFVYSSSNREALTIDENGLITTHAKGIAYVTVELKGNSTIRTRLRVTVGDELDITNNTLYHYYGGKDAVIPDSKNILAIDEEAFKDNLLLETIRLPISLTQLPENCFSGCVNLREVYLPAECTVIKANAFKDCVSLEKIVLYEAEDKITLEKIPGTLTLGRSAFEGCINLKTIENQVRITTAFDRAFAGCTSLETIDISGLRVGGSNIFEGCTALTTVTMSSVTYVGRHMFDGCKNLNHVLYKSEYIPDYAFNGCSSLSDFTVEEGISVTGIGAYAFAGTALASFKLPNGDYTVGSHAFGDCVNLVSVGLSDSTQVRFGLSAFDGCNSFVRFENGSQYYTVTDGVLYSADGTELVSVPVGKSENFVLPESVEVIGAGAFAGIKITSIDLSGVREIGEYAFAESALTAADLSELSLIPEGAFYGCASLASVTFSNKNTVIGDYAFAECTSLRQRIEVPDVTEIGEGAFKNSPVMTIVGNCIQKIGAYAFYGTRLYTQNSGQQVFDVIRLPALTELGSFAFANISNAAFRTIELGPITSMGSYVFADSTYLTSVTFGEGTEVIGDWAFVTASMNLDTITTEGISESNTRITRVTVPGTVKKIGECAFLNAPNLLSSENGNTLLDLSGVEEIGMGAFWLCKKVTDVDLSSVVVIGDYAFAESGILSANLASAKQIGVYAFSSSALKELQIPAVERIGANSFGNTQIETLTIPKEFDRLTYLDSWVKINDFGDETPRTDRYLYSFGAAAFAYNLSLKTITVAEGNPTYFTDEFGVLYGVVSGTKENGKYVLLTYPVGNIHNPNNSYTVLDNTVRIGDGALYGVQGLNEIHFPDTVKEIGSLAFFNCSAKHYYFSSVQAPILEAAYDETVANVVSEMYAYRLGMFYSNFYNYVAAPILAGSAYDFGLTLHCPENGVGYDNVIWSGFFSTVKRGEYAAEDSTLEVERLINALPTADAVRAELNNLATSEEKLDYLKTEIVPEISAVRAKYNAITSEGQLALIADSYEKLLALEAFMRDMRAQLGDPVELVRIEITQLPKYAYYIGESFDPTGMVIKAVYADTSEIVLSAGDYTISNAGPFTEEDTEISFTYQGMTCKLFIRVTEAPVTPPDPEKPSEGNGGCGSCGSSVLGYSGLGIGAVILVALGAVVFVRKKKN